MIVILDIETTEPITDKNNISTLQISLAGIIVKGKTQFFTKENISELFTTLDSAELIVGHNLFAFDYLVLQKYTTINLIEKYQHKTFDTFRILEKKTDRRISLNDLAIKNLGISKNGKGIDAPQLFKEGKIEELKEYLTKDLQITEQLLLHIQKHKVLKYSHTVYKEPIERIVTISIEDR